MEKSKNIKPFKILLLYFILFSFITTCKSTGNKGEKITVNNLVVLNNNTLSLEVLPSVGGRIVSVKRNGGKNILKSDRKLWNYKFTDPVDKRIYNNIIPFNGHIIWVGPQNEWWSRQNILQDLHDKKAVWPPDPYLIYGSYEILEQENDYLKLLGPASKYTGVSLTKTIILNSGKIIVKAEAKNTWQKPIAWDLWFNTRLDGFSKVYVPVADEKDIRVKYMEGNNEMPYKIENGYFFFNTTVSVLQKKRRAGKAFIYPSANKIFAFTDSEMFIIHFEKYDRKLIHPAQGMVEIYNSVDSKKDALMELEYHTPYQTINPEESIAGKEIWEVVEYRNGNSSNEQIDFINIYMGLTKNGNSENLYAENYK